MAAPEAFQLFAIQLRRPCPALRRSQHDHGPTGPVDVAGIAAAAGLRLHLLDTVYGAVHGGCHGLVHRHRLAAFHKQGLPAVAPHQAGELLPGDACQQGGVGDFVAVEVQHRQHGAVGCGVEELVDVPAGGQGPGFRLAIADAGQGDQAGVVEHRSAGVGEHVAQLAALVDRARGFGCAVATDVAGEGKLLKEALHAGSIRRLVGIDLAVGAVEVGGRQHPRGAMARARQINHVEVVGPDHPVGMGPDEGLTRARAPMPQQPTFDMGRLQRFAQQGVVLQVDHPHR